MKKLKINLQKNWTFLLKKIVAQAKINEKIKNKFTKKLNIFIQKNC